MKRLLAAERRLIQAALLHDLAVNQERNHRNTPCAFDSMWQILQAKKDHAIADKELDAACCWYRTVTSSPSITERALNTMRSLIHRIPFLAIVFAFLCAVAPAQVYNPDIGSLDEDGYGPLQTEDDFYFNLAPTIPPGLLDEADLKWKPTLDQNATISVTPTTITFWNNPAFPDGQDIPLVAGEEPIVTALYYLQNDSGDWLALYGDHTFAASAALKFGDGTGNTKVDRVGGFHGISIVGIPTDPEAVDRAKLSGVSVNNSPISGTNLSDTNGDIAFLNFDWDMAAATPITTSADSKPIGHLYFESQYIYAVANDLVVGGSYNPPGGEVVKTQTKSCMRLNGGKVSLHMADIVLKDALVWGDGFGSASEHVVYVNAIGSSEFVRCDFHGSQLSAYQIVTREEDRLSYGGGVYGERYVRGNILFKDCILRNCSGSGGWAVSLFGGVANYTIENLTYHVSDVEWVTNMGAPSKTKWGGGAIACWFDNKQWHLDDACPVGTGQPVAQGYSFGDNALCYPIPGSPDPCQDPPSGTPSVCPQDPGIPELGLPTDGYSVARSLKIIGGSFTGEGPGGGPFSTFVAVWLIDDVALVDIYEGPLPGTYATSIVGGVPFNNMKFQGVGQRYFARNGVDHQNGKHTPVQGYVNQTLTNLGYHAQALLHTLSPGSGVNWMLAGAGVMVSNQSSLSIKKVKPDELLSWSTYP